MKFRLNFGIPKPETRCGQVSYLRFGLILRTSRGWPSDKRLFTTVGSSA